jgi:conjugal transfer/entry exclusion protein
MKLLKKTLCSLALTFTLILPTTQTNNAYASGLPTVDLANLTQNLVEYLTVIEDVGIQLDHYENYIMELKNIEVPGLSIYKKIQQIKEDYEERLKRYNEHIGNYNSLKDILDSLVFVENELEASCANYNTYNCKDIDLKIYNAKKLRIMDDLRAMYTQTLKNTNEDDRKNSEKRMQRIKGLFDSVSENSTQGEVNKVMTEIMLLQTELANEQLEQINARIRFETLSEWQQIRQKDLERMHDIGSHYDEKTRNEGR